ncbi:MAG: hypothetical protein ACLPM3_01855 [Terracidiphilus sp.]
MFGLRPKLPVTEEERLWVDEGFRRLSRMLGSSRLQNAAVILPTDEFFPDPWDGSEDALKALFRRVCNYMGVNSSKVELAIIPDTSELLDALPTYSLSSENQPAGLHFGANTEEHPLVAVRNSLLKDPLAAVATLAHELGHVILIDGGHLQRDTEDLEPLTDLVTVYVGLGVFTANASRNFRKYQDDRREGWSMSRLGYLPETVFGYALAFFAKERGEEQPPWAKYLSTNLSAWFRQSERWLKDELRRSGDATAAGIYRRR